MILRDSFDGFSLFCSDERDGPDLSKFRICGYREHLGLSYVTILINLLLCFSFTVGGLSTGPIVRIRFMTHLSSYSNGKWTPRMVFLPTTKGFPNNKMYCIFISKISYIKSL